MSSIDRTAAAKPASAPEPEGTQPAATAPRPNPIETPGKPAGKPVAEIGGPKGPEPTRYGDWEVNGRCSDF
jgi:hypothetical protein